MRGLSGREFPFDDTIYKNVRKVKVLFPVFSFFFQQLNLRSGPILAVLIHSL